MRNTLPHNLPANQGISRAAGSASGPRAIFVRFKRLISERLEAIFPINKAFAVALAMLAAVAWLSLRNAADMLDFDRTEPLADDVIQKLDQLLFTLKDLESDQRAFLIIGDQKYLEPHLNAVAQVDHELAVLKGLTGNNPQQLRRLAEIETAIKVELAELEQTVDLKRSQNAEVILDRVRGNLGRGRMTRIFGKLNEFHAEEDRLRRERLTMKNVRARGLFRTMIAGYCLSFALLSLVFILLRKQIDKRVQAETSLVAQQEQLEETVTLRTRELEQANAALQGEIEERHAIDVALNHSNTRLDLLAEISSQLLKSYAPQEVVEDLCCKMMLFLDCHVFFNFLVDKEAGRLRLNAYAGIPAAEAERIKWLDYGVAVCGYAARDGQRIIAENIPETADPRTELVKGYGIQAYACHPLMMDGAVIGTLSFGTRNRTHFSAVEIALMKAVADQVAVAMYRQQTVESLRVSEERLRTLANAMPQLAWIAQPDGYIFWYNQRWYDYTGTTPEQMEGWGWQNVHDPGVLPKVLEEWRSSLATAQPFEMEFPLRGADGRFRQFLTRGYPLKDAEGRVVHWFGTNTDVSERKQAEERIQASLHEKEVLLKEIHHRVKNNLQVISSLVDLQADSIDDPALSGLFQDVRDRVRSMAMVHETLYRSDNLVSVDFAEYASSLLNYLWRAHGSTARRIKLTLDLQPVPMAVETAVPCGLLLNELAVNALKHAFAGRDQGQVVVSMDRGQDGLVILAVSDNGVGFPGGQDWRQKRSLGLSLVQMLVKQLKGAVEMESNGGTAFRITFTPAGVAAMITEGTASG